MEIKEEKVCPICDNHCPIDQLRCPRGREHFGRKDGRSGFPNEEEMTLDDKVIMMLRKCGHYLHHNVGRDGNVSSRELLAALSAEEKLQLLGLLKKCGWN